MATRDSLRIAWDISVALCDVVPRHRPKMPKENRKRLRALGLHYKCAMGRGVELLHFRAPVDLNLGVWFWMFTGQYKEVNATDQPVEPTVNNDMTIVLCF